MAEAELKLVLKCTGDELSEAVAGAHKPPCGISIALAAKLAMYDRTAEKRERPYTHDGATVYGRLWKFTLAPDANGNTAVPLGETITRVVSRQLCVYDSAIVFDGDLTATGSHGAIKAATACCLEIKDNAAIIATTGLQSGSNAELWLEWTEE